MSRANEGISICLSLFDGWVDRWMDGCVCVCVCYVYTALSNPSTLPAPIKKREREREKASHRSFVCSFVY